MTTFVNGHPDKETFIADGKYYSLQEFAEELDIPESTVRVWIHRGILDFVSYYGRIFIPENAQILHKKEAFK